MSIANQRIPVLVTATEKSQIAMRAKRAGLSVGEYMRRAAESYSPTEDEQALSAVIDQMLKATDRAESSIDGAIAFIEASNTRIAEMEAKHKKRGAG